MREIKFKAKRVDNGEWVYGYYWAESTRNSNKHHIYTTELIGETDLIRINGNFEVDPNTVCQFTGLQDKNGVYIYEGDFIKLGLFEYVVEFNECGFKAIRSNIKDSIPDAYRLIRLEYGRMSVIGNIHD